MKRILVLSAVIAAAAPAPAGAATHTQLAPPGNSALQEYFESVPSAAGGARIVAHRHRVSRLDRLGPNGRAVTNLVAAGGGTPAHLRRHRAGAASRVPFAGQQPSSTLPAVAHGVGSSGVLLGGLLAGTALLLGLGTLRLARRSG